MACIDIEDGGPAGSIETLQTAYNASAGADPSILLTAALGAFSVQGDAALTDVLQFDDDAGVELLALENGGLLDLAGDLDVGGDTTLDGNLTLDSNAPDLAIGDASAGAVPNLFFEGGAGTFYDATIWRQGTINQKRLSVTSGGALQWRTGPGVVLGSLTDTLMDWSGIDFDADGDVVLSSDLNLDGATGSGDLTMAGVLTVGGATLGETGSFSALTTAGWIQVYDTDSDATDKLMRLGVPANVNSQDNMIGLFLHARAISNRVHIGGGTSTGQAATEINFWVASAVNTATGTQEMQLTSGGLDIVDDLDMGGDLVLDGLGAGSGDILMAGDLDPSTDLAQDFGLNTARFRFLFHGVPAPHPTGVLDNETYTFGVDGVVVAQMTVGDVTGNLPAATAADIGKTFVVLVLTTANDFLLTPNGTDTINGVNAADTLFIQGRYFVTCTAAGAWSSNGPVTNT